MAEKSNPARLAGRPVSTRRTARVAEKLQQKIRDKEYYEAHQTYRVLYQRYKAQGKESEALALLYDGALLLLQHGQWSSGSDLGMQLISHLKENKTPVSDEWLDKIASLFCQYMTSENATPTTPPTLATTCTTAEQMDSTPTATSDAVFEVVPEVDSREGLLRAALKWSNMMAEGDEWKYGHPKLHKVAANAYWKEKQYGKAREHFLYAQQPQEFGNMLVEVATTFGYTGEADLFIAQAVLQVLVLKDRKGGLAVFNTYTRKHPKFKSDNPPYLHHPTLNFVWFLLSACKDRNREVFNCLKINYAPTIKRDPSFDEYLDKIGEAFFVPPNQHRPQPGGSAVPGPSGMFGVGGAAGDLIEGILNSISNVLPQAVNMAESVGGSASTTNSTRGPSQANITVTPGQTQHIHFGTVPVNLPPQGENPQGGGSSGMPFELPPGDFANLIGPQGIRFGAPPTNIQFGPPQMFGTRNHPPRMVNIRHVHHRRPHQNLQHRFNPQRPVNIHVNPAQGANVRFGPPHPGHISVVGFRMEGVPVQVAGGTVPMGMGNGPVITPAQQQLYQQHTQQQQQSGGSEGIEGQQNSTPAAGDQLSSAPPTNDDMELD